MNIVFFGTPKYVVPVVDVLHKTFKEKTGESPIAAVVTQKPKPSGRKGFLKYSPVDDWAHKKKAPKFFASTEIVKNNIQADLGVLASYGEIIPKEVLEHFPHGILNIHPSPLPNWRGASPVQATIIAEEKAGATIIKLDEKMDHGPIVDQFDEEIKPNDTTGKLRKRLFKRSAEVLKTLIPAYMEGRVNLKKQNHDNATFTKLIKKDDAFIDPKTLNKTLQGTTLKGEWNIPFMEDYTTHYSPTTIHRFIRAMRPWPIAWTKVKLTPDSKEATRLILHKTHLKPDTESGSRKTKNKLILDKVQLAGKTKVSWEQFKDGYPDFSFST